MSNGRSRHKMVKMVTRPTTSGAMPPVGVVPAARRTDSIWDASPYSNWYTAGPNSGDEYALVWGGCAMEYSDSPTTNNMSLFSVRSSQGAGAFALRIDPTLGRAGTTGTNISYFPTSSLDPFNVQTVFVDATNVANVGAPSILSTLAKYGTVLAVNPFSEKVVAIGGDSESIAMTQCLITDMNQGYWTSGTSGWYKQGRPWIASGPSLNSARAYAIGDSFIYTGLGGIQYPAFIVAAGGRAYSSSTSQNTYEVWISSSIGLNNWTMYNLNYKHEGGALGVFPDQTKALLVGGDLTGALSELVTLSGSFPIATVGGTQPSARHRFASGWDNSGKFWVIGGYVSTAVAASTATMTNETWYFTPSSGTWTQGPNLPASTAGGAFVCSGLPGSDEIFVIGGHDASKNPIGGYYLRTLGSPVTWSALNPAPCLPRANGHTAVGFGSGRVLVYGGEIWNSSASAWLPDPRAKEEVLGTSSSIPFTSSPDFTIEYTKRVGVYQTSSLLKITSAPGKTLAPVQSLNVSHLSYSGNGDTTRDLITGSIVPASGNYQGFSMWKDTASVKESLNFILPLYAFRNDSSGTIRIGTTAAAQFSWSFSGGLTPEFRSSTMYTPSNPTQAEWYTPQSAPGTSYTVSGTWMDQTYNIWFSNDSVYGAGVRFSGGLAQVGPYHHVFQTPQSGAVAYDGGGNAKYLRQNTRHDVKVTVKSGSSLVDVYYVFPASPDITGAWKTTNSGTIAQNNFLGTNIFYYKFDDTLTTGSRNMKEETKNRAVSQPTDWATMSGTGKLSSSWRLRGATSYVPGTPDLITNYQNSQTDVTGARQALARGVSQNGAAVGFWCKGTAWAGFGTNFYSQGWTPQFGTPPESYYDPGLGRVVTIPGSPDDVYGNGYIITIGGNSSGPLYGTGSVGGTADRRRTWINRTLPTLPSNPDATQNCIFQMGVDSNNYLFIGWDVGYGYKNVSTEYYPYVVYYHFTGYALPTDGAWHHIWVNFPGGYTVDHASTASLYVDNVLRQSLGGTIVGSTYNAMSGTVIPACPDYNSNPGTWGYPGGSSYVTLGPLMDMLIDDFYISRGFSNATNEQRVIDKANGVVY